jgi:4-amino-4-deoxy-L-arabinose transferase-like glycosyltransferase
MSGSLLGLVYLQLVYVGIGAGLLQLLGLGGWRTLAGPRLGLAYIAGVAVVGVLAAELVLIQVSLGLVELTVLALVLGVTAFLRGPSSAIREDRKRDLLGFAPLAALVVLLGYALVAVGRRPLLEFDGWAIWGMKARALYQLGGTDNPVFTTAAYPPLQHPLLYPSLEAIGFRAMGAFDPALFHVQLVLMATAFCFALLDLLAPRVPLLLAGLVTLAIVSAAGTIQQLASGLADVPLAFFVVLGVVALARWLDTDETPVLACAALFLGAAALTKSEGALFALAAAVALLGTLAVWDRVRLARAGLAMAAVLAVLVPWRIFIASEHLPNPEYSLGNAANPGYLSDHADRVGPAASGLADRIASGRFGFLLVLILLGVATGLVSRRYREVAFAGVWLALSFLGLVLVYWISNVPVDLTLVWSGDRTVTSIVLGGAALAPLLAAPAWTELSAEASETRRKRASAPRST